jgi:hypothetical protein
MSTNDLWFILSIAALVIMIYVVYLIASPG